MKSHVWCRGIGMIRGAQGSQTVGGKKGLGKGSKREGWERRDG